MAIRTQIVVCGGTGCMSSHSKEIKEKFEECIKELGLENEVSVFNSGCFGLCLSDFVYLVLVVLDKLICVVFCSVKGSDRRFIDARKESLC